MGGGVIINAFWWILAAWVSRSTFFLLIIMSILRYPICDYVALNNYFVVINGQKLQYAEGRVVTPRT